MYFLHLAGIRYPNIKQKKRLKQNPTLKIKVIKNWFKKDEKV